MTPVVAGAVIGAGLGVVNLVVGSVLTRRVLHKGINAVMTNIAGGFGLRLLLLVVAYLLFNATTAVSAASFGLTFVAFVFVYLAVEIFMVQQSRTRGTA